jgi:hypothetical protein
MPTRDSPSGSIRTCSCWRKGSRHLAPLTSTKLPSRRMNAGSSLATRTVTTCAFESKLQVVPALAVTAEKSSGTLAAATEAAGRAMHSAEPLMIGLLLVVLVRRRGTAETSATTGAFGGKAAAATVHGGPDVMLLDTRCPGNELHHRKCPRKRFVATLDVRPTFHHRGWSSSAHPDSRSLTVPGRLCARQHSGVVAPFLAEDTVHLQIRFGHRRVRFPCLSTPGCPQRIYASEPREPDTRSMSPHDPG